MFAQPYIPFTGRMFLDFMEVPYTPFTGSMFLDFLVIALLDQNIQNLNKMGGYMGQWQLPLWMQYVVGFGEL
jgi:hypothetical protein